eukprot:TRINITY_DN60353_c0_g1_i1.p1 TRINITY_DN60353_c0_g1~~TRINITY_DN60353_c0_g1_i1.p1  ORF type:complete len:396 (+),score=96.30 TRINITY_DN60353_c0_g1_i1:155-1189(+)
MGAEAAQGQMASFNAPAAQGGELVMGSAQGGGLPDGSAQDAVCVPVRTTGVKRSAEEDAEVRELALRLSESVAFREPKRRRRFLCHAREPHRGVKRVAGESAELLCAEFARALCISGERRVRRRTSSCSDSASGSPPRAASPSTAQKPEAMEGVSGAADTGVGAASSPPAGAKGELLPPTGSHRLRLGADAVQRCLRDSPRLGNWLRSDGARPLLRQLVTGMTTGAECTAPLPILKGMWPPLVVELSPFSNEPPSVPPSPLPSLGRLCTLRLDAEAVRAVLRAAGVQCTSGRTRGVPPPESEEDPADLLEAVDGIAPVGSEAGDEDMGGCSPLTGEGEAAMMMG